MSATNAVVFIVDDHPSIREALSSLIRSSGLRVAVFPSAEDFLRHPRQDEPSCLVLDVRLPGMSGIELHRDLTAAGDRIPTIFITAHGDVGMGVRAMKAGAVEFLTKPFDDRDLINAVFEALRRDEAARKQRSEAVLLEDRYGRLTPREREVAALVVKGLLNKQVAAQLAITEITIKVHRRRVMQKMRARSLAELVRMMEKVARRA